MGFPPVIVCQGKETRFDLVQELCGELINTSKPKIAYVIQYEYTVPCPYRRPFFLCGLFYEFGLNSV